MIGAPHQVARHFGKGGEWGYHHSKTGEDADLDTTAAAHNSIAT